MFGKKKAAEEKRFIIAIKNYNETTKSIKAGTLSLPHSNAIYVKLLDSENAKVDNLKELKKFIKLNHKIEKEVKHFWEGLIVEGYTLIKVQYVEKTPSIEHICNDNTIRFVCAV